MNSNLVATETEMKKILYTQNTQTHPQFTKYSEIHSVASSIQGKGIGVISTTFFLFLSFFSYLCLESFL